MSSLSRFARPSLFLLLGACIVESVCIAQTPKTYRLIDRSATGDVAIESDNMDMNATIELNKPNTAPITTPLLSRSVELYRNQVLAASGGNTNRERRSYTVFRDTTNPNKIHTSLQGKTILLERKGDKTSVTCENGTISAEDREKLSTALNGSAKFLPDRAIAIGDEWTPDAKALKSFGMIKDAKMHCKLVEVVTFAGHPCAHIHYTFSGKMPLDHNLAMQIKLKGEGYHAIDLQRTLSLTVTGPLSMNESGVASGADMKMSAKGTMTMIMYQKWEKVAGRPVSISGESFAKLAAEKSVPK